MLKMSRPQHHDVAPHRVEDLQRQWGVSPDSIRNALRDGRIKGFRFGRVWLIPDEEKQRIERGEAAAP
jgi:hypothetical protein